MTIKYIIVINLILLRFPTDPIRGPRPDDARALADGIALMGEEEDGFIVVPYMIDETSFSQQAGFPDKFGRE